MDEPKKSKRLIIWNGGLIWDKFTQILLDHAFCSFTRKGFLAFDLTRYLETCVPVGESGAYHHGVHPIDMFSYIYVYLLEFRSNIYSSFMLCILSYGTRM
jgi:hypothetical protein